MKQEQVEAIKWMRSRPMSADFSAAKIDAENGVISDVVMVQAGEAKGHGVHLEDEFINDLVAYDLKHYGDRGVKARLGHPGASDNTMGTQLGYFTNIRTRKKGGKMQAIGDLQLLQSADISPEKPNMREWVLSMSQEAPDWIMSSIVFRPGRYYQKKKDGGKKYIWEYTIVKDEDGVESAQWVYSDPKLGNIYVEFGDKGEHYFTDLVEDGAATENLFSTDANPHLFVSKALAWLDENPTFKSFAIANPGKVFAFLEELGITYQKPSRMSLLETIFGKKTPTEETVLSAEEITDLRTKMAQADEALTSATDNFKEAATQIEALKADLAAHKTELQAARSRVAELEAQLGTKPKAAAKAKTTAKPAVKTAAKKAPAKKIAKK